MMDKMTEMAVKLARKGASDDVIAMVMEALKPTTAPAAAAPAADAPAAPLVLTPTKPTPVHRRGRLYLPLLAAIRSRVAAHGPIETSARKLCFQHRAEWMQSRHGLTETANARGLAAVIARAIKHNAGVVGGLRFTFVKLLRGRGVRGGGGVCVYRVEIA